MANSMKHQCQTHPLGLASNKSTLEENSFILNYHLHICILLTFKLNFILYSVSKHSEDGEGDSDIGNIQEHKIYWEDKACIVTAFLCYYYLWSFISSCI
jgi:hypothetical protein